MNAPVKPAHSQFEAIRCQIGKHCQEFRLSSCDTRKSKLQLMAISRLLEYLPLDNHEFGGALLRLANAFRYVESAEMGAARYEVRLMEGILRLTKGHEPPDFADESADPFPPGQSLSWPRTIETA